MSELQRVHPYLRFDWPAPKRNAIPPISLSEDAPSVFGSLYALRDVLQEHANALGFAYIIFIANGALVARCSDCSHKRQTRRAQLDRTEGTSHYICLGFKPAYTGPENECNVYVFEAREAHCCHLMLRTPTPTPTPVPVISTKDSAEALAACCNTLSPPPLPELLASATPTTEFPMKLCDAYIYDRSQLRRLVEAYGRSCGFTYDIDEDTLYGYKRVCTIRCVQCMARNKLLGCVRDVVTLVGKRRLQIDIKSVIETTAAVVNTGHRVVFGYHVIDDTDDKHHAVRVNRIEPMHCCQLGIREGDEDGIEHEQYFLHDVVSELCDQASAYHMDFRKRRRIHADDVRRIVKLDKILSELK